MRADGNRMQCSRVLVELIVRAWCAAAGLPRRASSTSFEHRVEGAFRTRHGRKVLLGGGAWRHRPAHGFEANEVGSCAALLPTSFASKPCEVGSSAAQLPVPA